MQRKYCLICHQSSYNVQCLLLKNHVHFFSGDKSASREKELQKRLGHTDYRSSRHVASYLRSRDACSYEHRARVNKVKHLSRVNGNINTPRRLRLETSRANERGTEDFDAAGGKAGEGGKALGVSRETVENQREILVGGKGRK